MIRIFHIGACKGLLIVRPVSYRCTTCNVHASSQCVCKYNNIMSGSAIVQLLITCDNDSLDFAAIMYEY